MLRKRLIIASTIAYAIAIPLSFIIILIGLSTGMGGDFVSIIPFLLILACFLLLPPIIIQSWLLRGRVKAWKVALSAGISAILGGLLGGLVSSFVGWNIAMPIFFSLMNLGIGPSGVGWIIILGMSAIAGAIIGFLSAIPPIMMHREAYAVNKDETGEEGSEA